MKKDLRVSFNDKTVSYEQGRITDTWYARHESFPQIEGSGKTKEEAYHDLVAKVLNYWLAKYD